MSLGRSLVYSIHVQASYLSVFVFVRGGGFCSTTCGSVYFLCVICTNECKSNAVLGVGRSLCVNQRNSSTDFRLNLKLKVYIKKLSGGILTCNGGLLER